MWEFWFYAFVEQSQKITKFNMTKHYVSQDTCDDKHNYFNTSMICLTGLIPTDSMFRKFKW